jgi:hypothetical protein
MYELHNSIKVVNAITPAAVGTTGAANGTLSAVIDRAGYESVEFTYKSGTTGTGTDTITPIVYESDTATSAGFTAVADADLVGTEDAITLTAAATKKVGYKGGKRYVGIRLYGVGTATAVVAADAILGNARDKPVS